MAGTEEDQPRCPVCAETYTAEGYHLLTRLSCNHTVCSTCFQGKLVKKNRVDCPLCAETHQFASEFVSEITEGNEQEKEDLCPKHWWKFSLFCMEPWCETPVCAQCVKQEHQDHDFGNLEDVMGEKFEALLADVESLKKRFQSNEDKLITVRNNENSNSSTCIDNIRKNEKELIGKINAMTEKMVQKVLNQKVQLDNSLNEALAKIKDNSMLLESIKDTITYSGSISHKSFTDKMRAVKKSGEQVSGAMMEAQKYIHVVYQEGKTSSRKLKTICGQLKNTRKKIPFFKVKAMSRNVMKQRLLSKTLINSQRTELREQNRDADAETDEDSDVEIVEAPESRTEVIDISDDEDYVEKIVMRTEQTQQRNVKDEKKDKVAGSSREENKVRRHDDQKTHTDSGYRNIEKLFSARNTTENGMSIVRRRSKKRSAVTESDRMSSTRERSLLEEVPPWPKSWETIDLQYQGPPAKKARREQTRKETAHAGEDRNCQSTRTNVTPVQSPAFKLQVKKKGNHLQCFCLRICLILPNKIVWLIDDNLFIF